LLHQRLLHGRHLVEDGLALGLEPPAIVGQLLGRELRMGGQHLQEEEDIPEEKHKRLLERAFHQVGPSLPQHRAGGREVAAHGRMGRDVDAARGPLGRLLQQLDARIRGQPHGAACLFIEHLL
jgi:hypothetical protein